MYVLRCVIRLVLAGILSLSHTFVLSQAHAETAPQREAASRSGLLAFSGARPALNAPRLNQMFDRAPSRAKLRRQIPAGAVRVPENPPKRKPIKLRTLKNTRHPLVVPSPKATGAYRRTFRILGRRHDITDRYDDLIVRYSHKFKIDPRLLKAIMAAESEFNRYAVSPAGAVGLLQLMPRTAEEMGVPRNRLTDPESNIRAGAKYIAHLFQRAWRAYKLKGLRYHDAPTWVVQRVIAAYNAGPRFLYRNRWYRQTRSYVRKVLIFYQSRLTNIRRVPALENPVIPAFHMIRSSSGFYN